MQYRLRLIQRKNNRIAIFILLMIFGGIVKATQRTERDPFRPFPAGVCHPTRAGIDSWQLVGVVISDSRAIAQLNHPQQGMKRVRQGDVFSHGFWKVSLITLEKVLLVSLTPCPRLTVEITFIRR